MINDLRHYDVIVSPGHHREGDHGFRAATRSSSRSPRRDQAADQGGGRTLFDVKVDGGQHACPQGQEQGVPRYARPPAATSRKRS